MQYRFKVYQQLNNDELSWVAESIDLKYCIGAGPTPEAAISELAKNESAWLEAAKENGIDFPNPTIKN